MTERLYYSDSALLEFDGVVLRTWRDSDRVCTVLDRSAFYPTSGGQSCDRGTLGQESVADVYESEDGEVVHVTPAEVVPVGTSVHGVIDKARRRKNRQMHTAQHVLSQSCVRLFEFETVSVHLGDDYGAVELDTPEIGAEQLESVEVLAREIIADNLPVSIMFIQRDQALRLPLRKVPEREGTIRVIKVGEFDWSACGGTHCSSTAEIGLLKIIGVERMRGRVLIKFLSGDLACEDYQARFVASDALSRSLSCGVPDLTPKIEKLVAENRDLRRQAAELHKELVPIRAAHLALEADRRGRCPLVVQAVPEMGPEVGALLASETAGQVHGLAAIIASDKLLIAVSDDCGLHAGNIAKVITTRLGLRGGGGPKAAQIGGVDCNHVEQYRSILIEITSGA